MMALTHIGSTLKGKGRAWAPMFQELRIAEPRRIPLALPTRRHLSVDAAPVAAEAAAASSTIGASGSEGKESASAAAESIASSSEQASHVIATKPEALSLLRSQPMHYVVASLVGRTLMLHARDLFTLPRLNDVKVGDVLELDRIHEVGSRDYTLRAQDPMSTRTRGAVALLRRSVPTTNVPEHVFPNVPMEDVKESQSWAARLRPGGLAHVGAVLDKSTVRVRCTVVEHTKGPLELIVKKKRRKGYKRTIRHKQTYTRIRVEGIQLGTGDA